MSVAHPYPPEHVPVLSRGKHRNARKGACFMEFASYLAGERWSDHPSCTHPLLAALARGVNDHTSDEGRQRLAPLIPSVIGLTGDDLRVDARIALLCARTALPVVAVEQQRVMAVGVLSCERVLEHLGEPHTSSPHEASRRAVEQAPHAMQWARRFTDELAPSVKRFRRVAAPSIVANAVKGISDACVPDADELLLRLLVDAIGECRLVLSLDAETTGRVGADPSLGRAASR
ncbi:MAG TPA: hypothetical protein VK923_07150 [Euzebyales bacterium]|nr:hypothetical protein [Euzebyales bacterium]